MAFLAPHFEHALDGLQRNTVERLTLGNNLYHFLYLTGARQLLRAFAQCSSLETVTIHLANATPEAITLLLTGAARCRSLKRLNIVGGVSLREAKALATGLAEFRYSSRTPPVTSERGTVTPPFRAARAHRALLEVGGTARSRAPCLGSPSRACRVVATPTPTRMRGVVSPASPQTRCCSNCAGTLPRTPVRLMLSLFHLSDTASAALLEGLRRSERLTSGGVRANVAPAEFRPALERLGNRLEQILSRNRQRLLCVGGWEEKQQHHPSVPCRTPPRQESLPEKDVSRAARGVPSVPCPVHGAMANMARPPLSPCSGRRPPPSPPISPPPRRASPPHPLSAVSFNVRGRCGSSDAWSTITPPSRRYSPPQLLKDLNENHQKEDRRSPERASSYVSSKTKTRDRSCTPSPSPRPPKSSPPRSPAPHYTRNLRQLGVHPQEVPRNGDPHHEVAPCDCFVCGDLRKMPEEARVGRERPSSTVPLLPTDVAVEEEPSTVPQTPSTLPTSPHATPFHPVVRMSDIFVAAAEAARHLGRLANWAPLEGSGLVCLAEKLVSDSTTTQEEEDGITPTRDRDTTRTSQSVSPSPNSVPTTPETPMLHTAAPPPPTQHTAPQEQPQRRQASPRDGEVRAKTVQYLRHCVAEVHSTLQVYESRVQTEMDSVSQRVRGLSQELRSEVAAQLSQATELLDSIQSAT